MGIEVRQVAGHYGEFTVLVDETPVVSAGSMGWLGVLPSAKQVMQAVSEALRR